MTDDSFGRSLKNTVGPTPFSLKLIAGRRTSSALWTNNSPGVGTLGVVANMMPRPSWS